jgi:S-adenosylmethionine:tRNA ribosyltransferase-isomerase
MRTGDFDFELPGDLIAQVPAPARDQSRLLVLHRASGKLEHRNFRDLLEYLRPGDLLVLNDSKVIPARLRAANPHTGGKFEVLLLEENAVNDWWAMLRPAKRARPGSHLTLLQPDGEPSHCTAVVLDKNDEGHRRLRFEGTSDISGELHSLGEVPLPPYIIRAPAERIEEDRERYQTVFARPPGSVAAPTAGLHFTDSIFREFRGHGVQIGFVTLHVGPGTFAPVKVENLTSHRMHEERYELPGETAALINDAKRAGRRVVAVGTTALRVLESVAGSTPGDAISAASGRTRLFIHPPHTFRLTDALVTNFHLPRSTLLMLVSAFAAPEETKGREIILQAYTEAIARRYRFFSYGDAMLIL